ncbi:hypothetical protein Q7P37_003066 [Cladosporium fusiforme]
MVLSEFASQLRHQEHFVLAEVMEVLHDMQREQPEFFSTLSFKVGRRGDQEQSRIKHFGSYEGLDAMTRQCLLMNAHHWINDPSTFWYSPAHPFHGSSATGELIALYMNAKSDDS